MEDITATELKALLDSGDEIQLIDVRQPDEYAFDRIPGAKLTPLGVAGAPTELDQAAAPLEPSTAEVRAWARAAGLTVPDRGKLRPDIWDAWRITHQE